MITDSKIASMKRGTWLSDPAPKGSGRLLIRKTSAGAILFYFRYTLPSGARDTLPIGSYDAKSRNGFSLKEARIKAGELSRLYQCGTKTIRAHLGQVTAPVGATDDVGSNAQPPSPVANLSGRTLKDLIVAYCDSLARDLKSSARTVRYNLTHYVVDQFPALCKKEAAGLRPADFSPIFETMIGRGIKRTTASVRSCLHAAYQAALRAENDPIALPALRGFAIQLNPLASIPAMSQFNVAGERALSRKELAAYIRAVRAIPFLATRSALLVGLYLGGQRIEQLLRVQSLNIDLDGYPVTDLEGNQINVKTVTLYDPKGRRAKPREHLLPLFGEAESLINALRAAHPSSRWVFTSNGKTPTGANTLSHAVHEISEALLAAKILEKGFRLADIRRTCETQLSKLKVSKDIRAQIQSHGLGGVQARHYDKNDYMDEKYQALLRWMKALAEIEAEFAEVDAD